MSERRRMTGFEAKIASMEADLAKLKKFAAQKAARQKSDKITRIETGFLTGNFGDEINARETARAYKLALQTAYPGAQIDITYQTGQGSIPYDCQTRVWIDDETIHDSNAVDEIRNVLEHVSPVYTHHAAKKATTDSDLMQMKNDTVKKENDMVGWDAENFEVKAPSIMSEINDLEKKLDEDEPKEANYDNDQNERVVDLEFGKDDPNMIVDAADEDEADFEDDDEDGEDKTAAAPGIEDTIDNDHEQMVDEFKPDAPKEQGIEVVRPPKMASKSVEAKAKYASMIKEATSRLDKVASYLEKNGRKELAYRLDKVSDALEAKLNQK